MISTSPTTFPASSARQWTLALSRSIRTAARVGGGALGAPDLVEIEREPERMEIELANPCGVPLERMVHLRFGVPAQWLVDQKRGRVGEDQQDRRRGNEHQSPPAPSRG